MDNLTYAATAVAGEATSNFKWSGMPPIMVATMSFNLTLTIQDDTGVGLDLTGATAVNLYIKTFGGNDSKVLLDAGTLTTPASGIVDFVVDKDLIPNSLGQRDFTVDGNTVLIAEVEDADSKVVLNHQFNLIDDEFASSGGAELIGTSAPNFLFCKNDSGSNIAKGAAVRILGLDGTTPEIALADGEDFSEQVIGLCVEAITNGNTGRVAISGQTVSGIDVTGFSAGDIAYVGSAGTIVGYASLSSKAFVIRAGYILSNVSNVGDLIVQVQVSHKDTTGGEGITTSEDAGNFARQVDLDVNSLTADASPDGAADFLVSYDTSAGSHKKILMNNLPGGSNDKVKVTTNDTTEEFLDDSLTVTEGIQKAVQNPAANENLQIKLDVNGLTEDVSPAGGTDFVPIYDASGGDHKKVLLNNLPSSGTNDRVKITSNDTTADFLDNKITTSTGLATTEVNDGGIEYLRLDLDINSLTTDGSPDGAADFVLSYDTSAGDHKKILLNNLPGGGGGSNDKVKVTTNDTTEDFLDASITVAEGIQKAVQNPSADEDLQLKLDVNGLTEETSVDRAADFVPFYDTSAGLHRKIKPDDLITRVGVKRYISIPAQALEPGVTAGPTANTREVATNQLTYNVLTFADAASQEAFITLPMPLEWDAGTIKAKFYWTAASGSGTVIWQLAGLAYADGDALDTSLGTQVSVTDTLTTANDEHISDATASVTIGGTPAAGENIILRITRDGSTDTLAVAVDLRGILIEYTESATEPAGF